MTVYGQAISFNGNDMQTSGIQTADIDHGSSPTQNATMYGLSHTNRSAIPFSNYPSKTIPVTGRLVADNFADLDALIDTFKSYLVGIEQNLDIGYNGTTRRYIATATSGAQIVRPNNLANATFTVNFDCTYPFGRDTSTTTAWSATSQTSSSYTENHTFLGTAPAQVPVATITVNTVTDATGGYIIFGNNGAGQQITVTRTWSNGDVLVIDPTNPTTPVTVNGTAVDFSGAFPIFGFGPQTLTYLDNLSARNFDISVVYYPYYL